LTRILHISDIHCAMGVIDRILGTGEYDVVAVTGDVECLDVIDELSKVASPVLAVTGNMDDVSVMRYLREKGFLVEGITKSLGGLTFAGVSGIDPITSIDTLKKRLSSASVDILLSHHPPKNTVDRTFIGVRIGLRELRSLVEELKPLVHLCGHIHESRGLSRIGNTIIVNPGPAKKGYYAIIEVEKETRMVNARLGRI